MKKIHEHMNIKLSLVDGRKKVNCTLIKNQCTPKERNVKTI